MIRTKKNGNDVVELQFYLRRQKHKTNGMTLKEYAAATHSQSVPHLSREEFKHHFSPTEHDVWYVSSFFKAIGFEVVSTNQSRSCVIVRGTVDKINYYLDTELVDLDDGINPVCIHYNKKPSTPNDIKDYVANFCGYDTRILSKRMVDLSNIGKIPVNIDPNDPRLTTQLGTLSPLSPNYTGTPTIDPNMLQLIDANTANSMSVTSNQSSTMVTQVWNNSISPLLNDDLISDRRKQILNSPTINKNFIISPNSNVLPIGIPPELANGSTFLSPEQPQPQYPYTGANNFTWVFNADAFKAYGVPTGPLYGGTIGIFGSLNETWMYPDLIAALNFNSITTIPNIVTVSSNGAVSTSTVSTVEAMLDVTQAACCNPNANIAFYYCASDLVSFANNLWTVFEDDVNNPSVLSISYTMPFAYGVDYEDPIAALASIGITVCASSGDSGCYVDSNGDDPFQCPTGTNLADPNAISVGATALFFNANGSYAYEKSWSGSGGGISLYAQLTPEADLPSWQDNIEITFYNGGTLFSNISPYVEGYGRGIPDMAAVGDPNTGVPVFWGGTSTTANPYAYPVGGTSCSAPTVAAGITRLNSMLPKHIGAPMALFYSNPQMFTDILEGNNYSYDGADVPSIPYQTGFLCTPGWDAVSGWGSPKFQVWYGMFRQYGETYPKPFYSTRQNTQGQTWPRYSTGVR